MKLYQNLLKELKKVPEFIQDDGEVKKWVIIHKAQEFDQGLIKILLADKDLKAKFFQNLMMLSFLINIFSYSF